MDAGLLGPCICGTTLYNVGIVGVAFGVYAWLSDDFPLSCSVLFLGWSLISIYSVSGWVMAIFETIFIARPALSNQRATELTDSVVAMIKENGGQVGLVDPWGLRTLAYPIRKNRRGRYVLIGHDSSAEALNTLDKKLRTNEDILRFLSVRVETMPKAVAPGARRGFDSPLRGEDGMRRRGEGSRRDDDEDSRDRISGEGDSVRVLADSPNDRDFGPLDHEEKSEQS